MGQRTAIAAITLFLLLLGALGGEAGSFPTLSDGSILTTERFLELGQAALIPIFTLIASFTYIIKGISLRVDNGEIEPGDLLAILKYRDTYLYLVILASAVASLFGFNVFSDPEQQVEIASAIQIVGSILLKSLSERASGAERSGTFPITIEMER